MSTPNDERPPARRRAAPQLPDPMSPVTPTQQATAVPAPRSAPREGVPEPARPVRAAAPKFDPYDQEQWTGFTSALGGRVAVEAKELLAPLAKAYGLKTERAVIERLIIDAAREKLPDGRPAS